MDKHKSILNVSVSIGFKIITVFTSIVVRRCLILICGNDTNGLNVLFLSIVGFLAVAELGVGTAITFCMYRPIVENNQSQVAALFHLLRRVYLLVGLVIFLCGLTLAPVIHTFAKDYSYLDVEFSDTFILMLISVVVSYLFGAETALINAYKNNYITTAISSAGLLLQHILQIIVLLRTQSYTGYLICRIIAVVCQWMITEVLAIKKYGWILSNRFKIDPEIKNNLMTQIKSLFIHKIGGLLVFSVDKIIISAFIGVVALGEYSNYATIQESMLLIITLFFSSLTSVLGHAYVSKQKDVLKSYCEVLHLINFGIGILFHLGFYAIADNLIAILFAENLVAEKTIPMVITVNSFVQFLRQSALTFRDAAGLYYYDRWKPLVEGMINLVLSVILVRTTGVAGVILATIVTNLVICHVVEPYVLFRYGFGVPAKAYILRNYGMMGVFVGMLFLLDNYMQSFKSQWGELVANGFLSVGISILGCIIVFLLNRATYIRAQACVKEDMRGKAIDQRFNTGI